MTWWTAAAALTPIAAWDALNYDQSGLLDRVGTNKLLMNNPGEIGSIDFRNIGGKGVVNYLQNTIVLPAQYTLLVFLKRSQKVVFFSRSNITASAIWHEDNGNFYFRNDASAVTAVPGLVTYRTPQCFALVRGASAVSFYMGGAPLSTTIPLAHCPDQLGRVTGWRDGDPSYSLLAGAEFYGAAVWAGAATHANVQALEAALRAHLVAPPVGRFAAPLGFGWVSNNPLAQLPGANPAASQSLSASRRDVYMGGSGRVAGTVSIENVPGARQVRLFNKRSGLLVSEVWSSPTGQYEFNGVDADQEYFVVAHDHLRVYNAVVQDMLAP